MAFFTKKPVTIEAVQFAGIHLGKPGFRHQPSDNAFLPTEEACPEWLQVAFAKGGTSDGGMFVHSTNSASWGGSDDLILTIKTLEGAMIASPGDWIICGTAGEIYPCKPDIFADIYRPAKETIA